MRMTNFFRILLLIGTSLDDSIFQTLIAFMNISLSLYMTICDLKFSVANIDDMKADDAISDDNVSPNSPFLTGRVHCLQVTPFTFVIFSADSFIIKSKVLKSQQGVVLKRYE